MPTELCRQAKTLAARIDSGPALNPNELGLWWRIRQAIATGQIECVSSEEVLPFDVSVGPRRLKAGAKLHALITEVRKNGKAALAAATALLLDAHAPCRHYSEVWW